MKSNIGEVILLSGLRKGYIAKQLGVNPNTVSNWIKGKSYPTLDKAYKMSKLVNCKLDDLIE